VQQIPAPQNPATPATPPAKNKSKKLRIYRPPENDLLLSSLTTLITTKTTQFTTTKYTKKRILPNKIATPPRQKKSSKIPYKTLF
jgi:hypothetical protein